MSSISTPYADESEMQAAFARTADFNGALDSAGQLVYATGFTPPTEAFTVEKDGTRIRPCSAPSSMMH